MGKPIGAAGLDHPAALRAFTQEADLRDPLYLVKHGVPFDVAFSLSAFDRKAWIVTLGELDGLTWDYGTGGWR